jgi:hypothetical protein
VADAYTAGRPRSNHPGPASHDAPDLHRTSKVLQPEYGVELQFKVQTYDIDFAGIVSNQVYIRWLEDLRLEFLDTYAPLDRLLADGLVPVLVSTENIVQARPQIVRSAAWTHLAGGDGASTVDTGSCYRQRWRSGGDSAARLRLRGYFNTSASRCAACVPRTVPAENS